MRLIRKFFVPLQAETSHEVPYRTKWHTECSDVSEVNADLKETNKMKGVPNRIIAPCRSCSRSAGLENLLRIGIMAALTAISVCGQTVQASCQSGNRREAMTDMKDGHTAAAVTKVLTEWQAGKTVSMADIEAFGGLDKCFAAEPIPDEVWQRMQGKTYKKNPHIGRDDLRHIRALHWDYDNQMHVGEMICNKTIADRLTHILRQLFDAKYPIQRMLLPDVYNADDETQMQDNNSSCFCYRTSAGSGKLSKHARGLAVDINPLYNPYHKVRANGTRLIQPATAAKYCDRTKTFHYKIDRNDLCFRLFTEAGFRWGGDWKSCKDYQHFELKE